MVSFGTDMPGPVSHPDIQRLNQHLESGSHTPLKCVPNTGRVCAWNAHPLGHCLLTLPPLGGALLTCSFSQPHSPLPPAAFTLRKVNSTPSGYLPLLLPGDRGWCTSLPLILIRKACVPRSLEATTEPDVVTNAMSTVQKPQNRTRNIFFVTDKHSSI